MKPYTISMIGDNAVGKTTIANTLLHKKFSDKYVSTVGAAIIKIPFVENYQQSSSNPPNENVDVQLKSSLDVTPTDTPQNSTVQISIQPDLNHSENSQNANTSLEINSNLEQNFEIGGDEDVTWFYVWDTAGTEKYKALAPVYYRDSQAAVIVYDVSNSNSFENVNSWREMYFQHVPPSNPVLIIANKLDLQEPEQREIDAEIGRKFAESHNCSFLMVSAKTGENIDQILVVLKRLLKNSKRPGKTEMAREENKSKSCC
ncbi:Rab8 [Tritrichomonas foetus]|uniref:Rab8 n=1 Tax=Tritrichomonas foetus TaxID=1144522 RepID=A0A1J4JQ39_9EUKA|nr:Rab8 [Tritrichomonas foetus]|eukprot:OHS99645.1 Rab8 [Tritrichomonas foetus]